MNDLAFRQICKLFYDHGVEYQLLTHPPCRTSAESAVARTSAGAPEAIGAKAILVSMTFEKAYAEFNVLVLPGTSRVDSNR